MKENKFILYCVVCAIFVCRVWDMFGLPVDNTSDNDRIVLVEESAPDTVQEKAQEEKATANFVGCGSSFSSQHSESIINGERSAQYLAKNTIRCTCNIDGNRVEKTVVYQYSSAPEKVELDCNSKCGEICAKK